MDRVSAFPGAGAATADVPADAAFLAACLDYLQSPDDAAAATRLVRHLVDRNIPISDALHERLLRAQLGQEPYRTDLTATLVGLLLKTGRAPVPERLPAGQGPRPLVDILAEADAAGDMAGQFAWLWQAVVQHPSDPGGWAGYATAFAVRFRWPEARVAVSRALAVVGPMGEAAVGDLLAALRIMAEQSQLGDLDWQHWFALLSDGQRSSPDGAGLAVHAGLPEASGLVAAMLARPGEDPVGEALVAGMADYGRGDLPSAAAHFREAFERDFPAALRRVVMTCSAQAIQALGQAGVLDEFVEWLDVSSAGRTDDFLLMPASFAPEAMADSRRLRWAALDRVLASPILITQAKSGSVSVGSIFHSGFGLPTALYSLISTRVIPSWLADYLRGGACYVTHLSPQERNIVALEQGGARSLIVHLRDPRQVIVSHAEHRRRYANQLEGFAERAMPREDEAAFEVMLAESLDRTLAWVGGWVAASARLPITFTTFEEFVTDRDRFLDRMLAAYGGDIAHFDRSAAFAEHAGIDYHRRRGATDEWRSRLTRRQIERVNAAIPNEFWSRFHWVP